jgi:hypothetical protein
MERSSLHDRLSGTPQGAHQGLYASLRSVATEPLADVAGGGQPATLSVGVVEARPALARLLSDGQGVTVREAATLDGLADLITRESVHAVVLDPELPEGWPVSVGMEAAERFGGLVPLFLVCRSRQDASLLDERVGRHGVAAVMLREDIGATGFPDILRGEVARWRLKRRSAGGR